MIVITTGPWALPRMEIARSAASRLPCAEVVDGEQLGYALMKFRSDMPANFQEDVVWQELFTALCVHTARQRVPAHVLAPMNVHSGPRLSKIIDRITSDGEIVHAIGLRASRFHCEQLADSFAFFAQGTPDYHRVRNWQQERVDEYLEFVADPTAPVDDWIVVHPEDSTDSLASSISELVTQSSASKDAK